MKIILIHCINPLSKIYFKELTLFMKIYFSKNNNYFYFFLERNVGIEPTPRTGMFVFYLLNLFRIFICINKYIFTILHFFVGNIGLEPITLNV